MVRRIGMLVLGVIVGLLCAEVSARLLPEGLNGFVSTAEAVVGRPLTPISVSGVARRTARRCGAGLYDCESYH